jgi:hypothetical protein
MAIIDSRYVGSWYFLKTVLSNVSGTSYILANNVVNNSDLSIAPKDLIQGEAGTLVIDQLGRKDKITVTGDALIIKNAAGNYLVPTTTVTYKDVFDLLIDDYYLLLNWLKGSQSRLIWCITSLLNFELFVRMKKGLVF